MKVFSLISSFFTMILIFLASDVVLQFGAYGGVILCASFFAASLFIYLFRYSLFRDKSEVYRKALLHLTLFIYLLEVFILHVWVISSIARYVDDKRLLTIIFGSMIILLLVLFFVKRTSELFVNACIFVNLLLIFVMAIMLPNFIYLQKGLETVYHNLIHYHPKVLHSSREGLWVLFFALTFLFFVRIYIVLFLHAITLGKLKSYLLLLSICVGSVMLAFSTMIIVAVTERVQAVHPSVLIISMLDKLMNPYMFTFIWIAMIGSSLISVQLTWTFIKRKIGSSVVEMNPYYFPIGCLLFVCVLIAQFVYVKDVYVLDLLLFFATWLIPLVIMLNFTAVQAGSFRKLLGPVLFIYLANIILFFYVDYSLAFQVNIVTVLTIILASVLRIFENKLNK